MKSKRKLDKHHQRYLRFFGSLFSKLLEQSAEISVRSSSIDDKNIINLEFDKTRLDKFLWSLYKASAYESFKDIEALKSRFIIRWDNSLGEIGIEKAKADHNTITLTVNMDAMLAISAEGSYNDLNLNLRNYVACIRKNNPTTTNNSTMNSTAVTENLLSQIQVNVNFLSSLIPDILLQTEAYIENGELKCDIVFNGSAEAFPPNYQEIGIDKLDEKVLTVNVDKLFTWLCKNQYKDLQSLADFIANHKTELVAAFLQLYKIGNKGISNDTTINNLFPITAVNLKGIKLPKKLELIFFSKDKVLNFSNFQNWCSDNDYQWISKINFVSDQHRNLIGLFASFFKTQFEQDHFFCSIIGPDTGLLTITYSPSNHLKPETFNALKQDFSMQFCMGISSMNKQYPNYCFHISLPSFVNYLKRFGIIAVAIKLQDSLDAYLKSHSNINSLSNSKEEIKPEVNTTNTVNTEKAEVEPLSSTTNVGIKRVLSSSAYTQFSPSIQPKTPRQIDDLPNDLTNEEILAILDVINKP